MANVLRNAFRGNRGFTIIEILIATLITSIVATAAFHFYVSMHNQVITQMEVSDMQQVCRASLQEIGANLRMAGYKLPEGHDPFEIVDDHTLRIYFAQSDEQPVDTVTYFLQEFSDSAYASVPGLPEGATLYWLMKQVNYGTETDPQMFSEFLTDIQFTEIDSSTIAISIWVQSTRRDDAYSLNGGYHTFTNTERVNMRNVSM